MADLSWIAQEARSIHSIFESIFYGLITVLLLLGIIIDYFKWPIGGGLPGVGPLVGRILIAAILLHSYTDVTNLISEFTDGLAAKLGNLNQINLVLSRMSEKLHDLTWSWISVKDGATFLLSFVTFFLLYFSVHVANAFILYTWTLLYVFSPLLIALYVIPATSGATKALYRSLIEVGCWKIVWSVLATLLWSAALSDINQPGHDISFLTSICFNLILAGSLLLTPIVVHSLAGAGFTSMAKTVGGLAVGGIALSPKSVALKGSNIAKHSPNYLSSKKRGASTNNKNVSKPPQKTPSIQESEKKDS
jgi:hypothetical protein